MKNWKSLFLVLCIFPFFGWLPNIMQYLYLNPPVFSCCFSENIWRTIIQYLPYFFRGLPTSFCLTPENPVSSLQVADAVRYVHAQKMVHRAAWMKTCICLRFFYNSTMVKHHQPTIWESMSYLFQASNTQIQDNVFSGFCMSTCFLFYFIFPLNIDSLKSFLFFGRRLTFFFAREIWSNPAFCCRNDAISRDVGPRGRYQVTSTT